MTEIRVTVFQPMEDFFHGDLSRRIQCFFPEFRARLLRRHRPADADKLLPFWRKKGKIHRVGVKMHDVRGFPPARVISGFFELIFH